MVKKTTPAPEPETAAAEPEITAAQPQAGTVAPPEVKAEVQIDPDALYRVTMKRVAAIGITRLLPRADHYTVKGHIAQQLGDAVLTIEKV
jgi:hypothetical protein